MSACMMSATVAPEIRLARDLGHLDGALGVKLTCPALARYSFPREESRHHHHDHHPRGGSERRVCVGGLNPSSTPSPSRPWFRRGALLEALFTVPLVTPGLITGAR